MEKLSTTSLEQKLAIQMPTLVISALISFWVSIAHAEIYQCNGVNGEVQFSDKPCGKNIKIVELDPSNSVELNPSNSGELNPSNSGELNPSNSGEIVELSNTPDLLVCVGEPGANLPIKLCQRQGGSDCQFRYKYLKNIITDVNTLDNDLSEKQIDLLKKHAKPGTEIWEFSGRSNEWDDGTGIRGYVVIRKTKAIYFVPVFYQGLPNKPPIGDIRHLSLKGRDYKRCEHKNIMDKF